MSNSNEFSDWQESVLFEDDVYDQLRKEIMDNNLPLLTKEIMEDMPEEKYNVRNYSNQENPLEEQDQEQFYPRPEAIPTKEEFPGHLNFQLLLPNQNAPKHWVYSQNLQKVFINMEQTLPLRFKWDPPLDGLYLRTSMVFSLDQYRNDPVQRCHNHMAQSNRSNQDIDPRIIKHVVRCTDPLSMYEENNEHLSIVTPLRTPQVGSQYVQMYFKFFCKNSCTSGMNRRPTELVFTLEDHMYKVIGRRRLLVRVCSCPKRDKEKEEAEVMNTLPNSKKRKLSASQNKKVMLPSYDTHVYNVQLNIVGKENYLAVMKYAYDVMAGQASRTGQFEFFKPYMDDILHKMP
ncbi:cellular tumor antigen p53-like [Vespa mandarinia]|uniref:cellular tumor antigen p53-like n=3 Tax=Vespa TaxID=7443 RepID=UPI00161B23F7|nr:cellular tumor antigen p53-like [Vespa mandarinia]XP_046813383.1 cellular tumor antigen p53 isoform X1 [Vespa crabro]